MKQNYHWAGLYCSITNKNMQQEFNWFILFTLWIFHQSFVNSLVFSSMTAVTPKKSSKEDFDIMNKTFDCPYNSISKILLAQILREINGKHPIFLKIWPSFSSESQSHWKSSVPLVFPRPLPPKKISLYLAEMLSDILVKK